MAPKQINLRNTKANVFKVCVCEQKVLGVCVAALHGKDVHIEDQYA